MVVVTDFLTGERMGFPGSGGAADRRGGEDRHGFSGRRREEKGAAG